MENAPVDAKKVESKKKKAKSLGHVAAISERSRRESRDGEKSDKPRSMFHLFEDKTSEPVDKKEKKVESPTERLKILSAEVKPATEAEAPDNEMGGAEVTLAGSLLAEQALRNIPDRTVGDEIDPEAGADLAARDFLERVKAGQAIQAAAEATSAELGASIEDVEPTAPSDMDPDVELAAPTAERAENNDEVVFDRAAENQLAEDEEQEAATVAGASKSGSSSPSPPRTPYGVKSGPTSPGGSGLPPHSPAGLPPFGFGTPLGSGPSPGFNTYAAPAAMTTPNTALAAEQYSDRGNPAAAALIGGIIGYFIGRRRGRIRTEKKLLPVQKKLEKQVNDLQWQLKATETKVRRVASEKVRNYGPQVVEKLRKPVAEKPKQEHMTVEQRKRAPEASLLHGQKAPERIGHVLVAAAETLPLLALQEKIKSSPATSSEQVSAELPKNYLEKLRQQPAKLITEKRIETLNRAELLNLSEKIVVGGSSLRQIYETHLVGERGLRRLVSEHLRGGDVQKALRREIVEHEIDFERDPIMRDMASHQQSPAVSGGGSTGNAALNQLLRQASLDTRDSTEQAALFKAQARYEAMQLQQQHKHRQLADISLYGVIVLLIFLVAYLFLNRG